MTVDELIDTIEKEIAVVEKQCSSPEWQARDPNGFAALHFTLVWFYRMMLIFAQREAATEDQRARLDAALERVEELVDTVAWSAEVSEQLADLIRHVRGKQP